MAGQVKEKEAPEELTLDAANREVLSYSESEEAEADRLLAESLGQEPPKKEEPAKAEEPGKGLPGKEEPKPGEPVAKVLEKEPKKPEDPELDLPQNEMDANRVKAARTKMMESNEAANKANARVTEIEKENADLRAKIEAGLAKAPEAKEPEAKEPDDVDKSLETLKAEYPEIADPLLKALHKTELENKALKERMDGFDKKETQRVADNAKTAEDAHYDAIAEAHPDFEEISQEPLLDNWIQSLPAIERTGAEIIKDKGSPADVIDLLTRFKEANGYKAPAKKANSKLEKAKSQATPSFGKTKDVNTQGKMQTFTREQVAKFTDKEWADNEEAVDEYVAELARKGETML